jgi:hypothetical protein
VATEGPFRSSTRSRITQALALAAIISPLGLAPLALSCLLLDPPPDLPTIPLQTPVILSESVSPPLPSFTNWAQGSEMTFVVPVEVDDPASTFDWYVFEDVDTPISSLAHQGESTANLDGGAIQLISFSVDPPPGPSSHTITFYADVDTTQTLAPLFPGAPDYLVCTLCSSVTWIYDPSGSGTSPTYDAGGIPDADILREGSADVPEEQVPSVVVDP